MAKCPWYSGCNGRRGCNSNKIGDRSMVYIDDKVCEGKQVNNKRYTDCPRYQSPHHKRSTGHRKCPHAVMVEGYAYNVVRCNSPANPKAKNGMTKAGVEYNRCAEGRRENGKTYTQCPYYTTQRARTVSKNERQSLKRKTIFDRMHDGDRRLLIFLIVLIALYFLLK